MWWTSTNSIADTSTAYYRKPSTAIVLPAPNNWQENDMQTICNQSSSSKLQPPPYHQYLTKKFKWQPWVIEMLEWRIIELASRRFTLPDQTRIQNLTHKWLPTRISPGNTPTNEQDKLCPSCRRSNKTANHLLACNHPNRHQIFNELNQQLVHICMKNQIDPNFCQILWLGLQSAWTSNTLHSHEQYPINIQKPKKLDGINSTMAAFQPNRRPF